MSDIDYANYLTLPRKETVLLLDLFDIKNNELLHHVRKFSECISSGWINPEVLTALSPFVKNFPETYELTVSAPLREGSVQAAIDGCKAMIAFAHSFDEAVFQVQP